MAFYDWNWSISLKAVMSDPVPCREVWNKDLFYPFLSFTEHSCLNISHIKHSACLYCYLSRWLVYIYMYRFCIVYIVSHNLCIYHNYSCMLTLLYAYHMLTRVSLCGIANITDVNTIYYMLHFVMFNFAFVEELKSSQAQGGWNKSQSSLWTVSRDSEWTAISFATF